MQKYTIGLITGALLAVSAMMFIGAQNKNLGNITVNSITVLDDGYGGFIKTLNADGKKIVYLGTSTDGFGFLQTYNADGKETVYLGTAPDGSGKLHTYNADGKLTAYLGTGESGSGFLETHNTLGVMTGYFGTDNNNDGIVTLSDRYGDKGWRQSGKQ